MHKKNDNALLDYVNINYDLIDLDLMVRKITK